MISTCIVVFFPGHFFKVINPLFNSPYVATLFSDQWILAICIVVFFTGHFFEVINPLFNSPYVLYSLLCVVSNKELNLHSMYKVNWIYIIHRHSVGRHVCFLDWYANRVNSFSKSFETFATRIYSIGITIQEANMTSYRTSMYNIYWIYHKNKVNLVLYWTPPINTPPRGGLASA